MEANEKLIKALQGTRKEHDWAVRYLCQNTELKNGCNAMIRKMGGSQEAMEDVFWESITNLVENICLKKFKGNSSIKTYFLSICRFTFLNKYKAGLEDPEEDLSVFGLTDFSPEEMKIEQENEQLFIDLYKRSLSRLDERCRQILEMVKRGASRKALAEELGHKKEQSAGTAAYRCREKLREIIMQEDDLRKQILDLL